MEIARSNDRAQTGPGGGKGITHLREISREQWRSGIAAWLGWTFDGLDMHLYTLVDRKSVV